MATFSIAASGDNAFQKAGSVTTGGTNSTNCDATDEYFGLRFTNVTVPQGATITEAYVTATPFDGANDEPLHTIWADDVDNSAAWVAGAGSDMSGRTPTTATASWDVADLGADGATEYNSPSLVSIIQEIVDRVGWSSGNALSLIVQGTTGARDFGIWFLDNASTPLYVPRLTINYTTSGVAVDPLGKVIPGNPNVVDPLTGGPI